MKKKTEENEVKVAENFSGIFLGLIIGFIIGFLLKEEEKKKLLAFLKKKFQQMEENLSGEGKKEAFPSPTKSLPRRFFFRQRGRGRE